MRIENKNLEPLIVAKKTGQIRVVFQNFLNDGSSVSGKQIIKSIGSTSRIACVTQCSSEVIRLGRGQCGKKTQQPGTLSLDILG